MVFEYARTMSTSTCCSPGRLRRVRETSSFESKKGLSPPSCVLYFFYNKPFKRSQRSILPMGGPNCKKIKKTFFFKTF